jgi:UDP-N-acetylmuramoylalanine--D-glutamate ligase
MYPASMSLIFACQHYLVLGLGQSGSAAARLILRQGGTVTAWDESINEATQATAKQLEKNGAKVFLGAPTDASILEALSARAPFTQAFISPGIDPRRPEIIALTQGSEMISELDLVAPFLKCPIISITGTNGKTTTTEIIEHILRHAGKRAIAAGNIGTPLAEIAETIPNLDYLIAEISSFQLEKTHTFHPHIALILNITPDHLDRYASMQEYASTKWKIAAGQSAQDFIIHNANLNPLVSTQAQPITFTAYPHQHGQAPYWLENGYLTHQGEPCLLQRETKLIGIHNAENMLAALAAADCLKIPRSQTLEALRTYQPQPHRCELIATINGVHYVNDSKGTNLDAILKALEAVPGPAILIAGGKDKDLDFASIGDAVARYARHAILIGEAREKIHAAWRSKIPITLAVSLEEAVTRAAQLAKAGQTVLLSPGCASFDMFRNYKHRGEVFRQSVLAITNNTKHTNSNLN